jgi:hypothetical protein
VARGAVWRRLCSVGPRPSAFSRRRLRRRQPLLATLPKASCPCLGPAPSQIRPPPPRGDLEETDGLFHDAKSSARLLAAQADKYIS